MLSMTGFGSGEGRQGSVAVTVELRSVNHRFLDVSLRLPTQLMIFEYDIRNFLKENMARGRVTVSAVLTFEPTGGQAVPGLNAETLGQALAMLRGAAAAVEKETGQPQRITLADLVRVPDLMRSQEPEADAEDLRAALMAALAAARRQLLDMKEAEGRALVAEMSQRLTNLEQRLAEVNALAPQAAQEIQAKLQERLAKILGDTELDAQRLAMEVALLADKTNINEECERLGIHLEQFRQALQGGGQVAKRLNFLLQEMHREVNTMGSKTNLMPITQAVIAMKDEVESLREQVQNLE